MSEGNNGSSVRLVTSLDGPYAIFDCLKCSLGKVRKQLLISAPWTSKGFVCFLRDVVPSGVEIYLMTRLPEKESYSFQAVDSLLEIAGSKGWKVNVRCSSRLHSKFFVVDDDACISGSVNPTESGIHYNHEHLIISVLPNEIRELSDYFFKLWRQPENIGWQNVRQFHGYTVVDRRSITKDIAEKIMGFFLSNGNSPTPRWKVCKEMIRLGYDESDIIDVLRNLVRDGILYEPKLDHICLASAHLD
jgi:hypothetical protein